MKCRSPKWGQSKECGIFFSFLGLLSILAWLAYNISFKKFRPIIVLEFGHIFDKNQKSIQNLALDPYFPSLSIITIILQWGTLFAFGCYGDNDYRYLIFCKLTWLLIGCKKGGFIIICWVVEWMAFQIRSLMPKLLVSTGSSYYCHITVDTCPSD